MALGNQTASKIATSAGAVGSGIFVSRLFGLIREQVLAGLFGAGFALDAFIVAYRIPGMLRELMAQGALSPAVVTVFSKYASSKPFSQSLRLYRNLTTTVFIVGLLTAAVGAYLSRFFVTIIAPDFAQVPGKLEIAALMCAVMFPSVAFVGLSTVAMGVLNTVGKFFIPSIATVFFNLGIIGPGVFLAFYMPRYGFSPILGIAVGVLIGGFLQFAFQVPLLKRRGFTYSFLMNPKSEGMKRIGALIIPAVLGVSANQINIFISTFFASSCGPGSVTWLSLASRINMFPLGLIGASIATASLPMLGKYSAQNSMAEFKAVISSSTVYALLLVVPATASIVILSHSIITVVYEHGVFGALDTLNTAHALSFYALGILSIPISRIFIAAFYALGQTKFPVVGSLLSIVFNIIIVLFSLDALGYKAIALSSAICAFINVLFLSVVLFKMTGGFSLGYIFSSLFKIGFSTIVPAIALYYGHGYLLGRLGSGLVATTIALLLSLGGFLVLYLLFIRRMNIDEANLVREKVFNRLGLWLKRG